MVSSSAAVQNDTKYLYSSVNLLGPLLSTLSFQDSLFSSDFSNVKSLFTDLALMLVKSGYRCCLSHGE